MKYIYMVRKNAAIAATTVIALLMVLLRLLLLTLSLPLLLSLTYRTNSPFLRHQFLNKFQIINQERMQD